MSIYSAAAERTERILLGTSIMRTWSRHPVTAAEQAFSISSLAPGRFRLGLGPSHQTNVERTFGIEFMKPLGHLREYINIVKSLLQDGSVSFKGEYYSADFEMPSIADDVMVMASALRTGAFQLSGEVADGAISWVCPHFYAVNDAKSSLQKGAESMGRATPPLVLHAPMLVTEKKEDARAAVRAKLGYFPTTAFYSKMFEQAGFLDWLQSGWTDEMIDSILITGSEDEVAHYLDGLFEKGVSEVLASVVADFSVHSSTSRTMRFIADYCSSR